MVIYYTLPRNSESRFALSRRKALLLRLGTEDVAVGRQNLIRSQK